ncbi:glycoside hydrolase family 9 protein [Pontibacter sp. SGAir0037]|uniref:glycoside hydrolase family 9 protein n=1 Tax=Pontibacter sp. SGAir0037 TaxID=2571030 RepID=UPI0010CD44D8|nr:glycoside hydrolase family 9 protein [Pontibacter sp. SGAir0037]QCR23158.1 LacI family transcriptional regulator [Pontibacter sp. SGAir0037]
MMHLYLYDQSKGGKIARLVGLLLLFLLGLFLQSPAQSISKYIVVDQFGYPETARKVAVIRNPVTGFDAAESFQPGTVYRVVNASTGQTALEGTPTSWNNGQEDPSSGDKAWHFDFSLVTTPGTYYVLDVAQQVKSYDFMIHNSVYQNVLKQAVRTYFYQRAGMAKEAKYAGAAWADAISYAGNLQDSQARLYNAKTNAATQKDLSGGWFDAGDMNKYVNFVHGPVIQLLRAYEEKPAAWTDNYNIPESGNGIPDILDEVKYEIDWLWRMQNADGSVLSIVGYQGDASPPSSDKTQRCYGPASTSATLTGAAIYAYAAKVYKTLGTPAMLAYADQLQTAAEKAWAWADANPDVLFRNNDNANNSQGLGAGQQEVDDYTRSMFKLSAATFLYALTDKAVYKAYFDANYTKSHLFEWSYAYPFEPVTQDALLYYTSLPNATESVKTAIRDKFTAAMKSNSENLPAITSVKDPYLAHLNDYTWGSNSFKMIQGLMIYDLITYDLDPANTETYQHAAAGYVHSLHGVNPMQLVYLSNMFNDGAENGVREFYHSWFKDGSAKWDRVGTSQFGPPPGFLTGGPNPSYDWDGVCPGNAGCNAISITPPKGQPAQKSYKDFNHSWPLNSWSVTENSTGYQANYIRLLSKFVTLSPQAPLAVKAEQVATFSLYPNPAQQVVHIGLPELVKGKIAVKIQDVQGKEVLSGSFDNKASFSLPTTDLADGIYILQVMYANRVMTKKFVKQ